MTPLFGGRGVWRAYGPLMVLCWGAIAGTALLQGGDVEVFRPYFGPVPPLLATSLVAAGGTAALTYLSSQRWFALRAAEGTARGLGIGFALALAFAVPVVGVDLAGGFARDINVFAPESLLFYPVIALVAELAFHAMPLALLLLGARPLVGRLGRARTRTACLVAMALIEPALQIVWTAEGSPGWASAYVGVHVLAINLTGLYLFARFDFLVMYGFRVAYYLLWHVAWGALRLTLLFG